MTAPLIWVVEDDSGLRASLCDLMRSAGYSSEAFTSADELLEMAVLSGVDCIVTDIHVPGRTGLELLRAVKGRHANIVVIVMTADGDARWRAEAMACGAEAFLEKPFDAVNLLELIAASLARCNAAAEPRR